MNDVKGGNETSRPSQRGLHAVHRGHGREGSEPKIRISPPKENRPSMLSYADVPSPPSPPPLKSSRMAIPRAAKPSSPDAQDAFSSFSNGNPANISPTGHNIRRTQQAQTPYLANPTPTASTSTNSARSWPNASASSVLGDWMHRYSPLEESSIRLLRILPERKTMIKCDMIHVSIEDPLEYVAISYAWGDAGDTRRIELNGYSIPVSVSLHGALQALRERDRSVLVWADALCIDQQNADERAQQVQLMPDIYSSAVSIALWLGPEQDGSSRAVLLLREIAHNSLRPDSIARILASCVQNGEIDSIVSLFERPYWRRLWVVQEVFNARDITVYCGHTKTPWDIFQHASNTFNRHRADIDSQRPEMDKRRTVISLDQLSHTQVLIYQGPASLPDLRYTLDNREGALLDILRTCRRKLASDPRDKLFGILGVLPHEVRSEFRPNYSLSTKEVYTDIVDFLLKTTERLDVMCEAIHFPINTSAANLPSFVPDWSHIPQTTSLGHKFAYYAGGSTKADAKFLEERLNRLEISAIPIGKVDGKGVAVGTLCNVGDYVMAFLHWRALLLEILAGESEDYRHMVEEDFARTLCLGQIPTLCSEPGRWLTMCYHLFANVIRDRLPYLPLDAELSKYLDVQVGIKPKERRGFLQKHFGDRMMGRCFCFTGDNQIGMGTGFMLPGDLIVVPLGCSTPILLRAEGTRDEYRFVGDVYMRGYMRGKAVDEWKSGKRELRRYVLH